MLRALPLLLGALLLGGAPGALAASTPLGAKVSAAELAREGRYLGWLVAKAHAAPAAPSAFDVIETNNGVVHRGRIVEERVDGYLFEEDGRTLLLPFSEIAAVHARATTPGPSPVPPAATVLDGTSQDELTAPPLPAPLGDPLPPQVPDPTDRAALERRLEELLEQRPGMAAPIVLLSVGILPLYVGFLTFVITTSAGASLTSDAGIVALALLAGGAAMELGGILMLVRAIKIRRELGPQIDALERLLREPAPFGGRVRRLSAELPQVHGARLALARF